MSKEEQLKKATQFVLERGFSLDDDVWVTHSGHLGVYFKGMFAGHSMASVVAFVADELGKKVIYKDE